MIREPIVQGSFYPDKSAELARIIDNYLGSPNNQGTTSAKAIMAPHAGYFYSGAIAGDIYRNIVIPDIVFVLCPNHTGHGPLVSVYAHGKWRTPLGDINVTENYAAGLIDQVPSAKEDYSAHLSEHSIEVQLPFIQRKNPSCQIIPICLYSMQLADIIKFGKYFGQFISKIKEPYLIVVSSDMNHYESANVAEKKDSLAIKEILDLNPQGLYQVVAQNQISMCGYIPMVGTLEALKVFPQIKASLISKGHSGQQSNDNQRVVGYASILFE